MLQCGRIYKDAEIGCLLDFRLTKVKLQCGRIYKDAEMRRAATKAHMHLLGFNVAASIKMRKSRDGRRDGSGGGVLQCGRIYKDAEMLRRR